MGKFNSQKNKNKNSQSKKLGHNNNIINIFFSFLRWNSWALICEIHPFGSIKCEHLFPSIIKDENRKERKITWFLKGWCWEGLSRCAWLSRVMADAPESTWTVPTGVGWEKHNKTDTTSVRKAKDQLDPTVEETCLQYPLFGNKSIC